MRFWWIHKHQFVTVVGVSGGLFLDEVLFVAAVFDVMICAVVVLWSTS